MSKDVAAGLSAYTACVSLMLLIVFLSVPVPLKDKDLTILRFKLIV